MAANWYKIADFKKFKNGNITQKKITVTLEDVGNKEIILINGIMPAVIFEMNVLVPKLNGRNPAIENRVAAFIDETGWLWLGVENAVDL